MRAVKLVGPGRIEIRDVPIPEISETEVLVRVVGAGLTPMHAVETVAYPLDDAQRAFDDLEAGRISGRAVLVP